MDEILERVRHGRDVCVAFPGHPGLFSRPTREAIRRARDEGFAVELLPGISAEDCLFADLAVDPSQTGWQSYEATDLLVHRRAIEPSAALVVWQPSIVGDPCYSPEPDGAHLALLVEYLGQWYEPEHEVIVYEASPYPVLDPSIERLHLAGLAQAAPGPMATLYFPPAVTRTADPALRERFRLQA